MQLFHDVLHHSEALLVTGEVLGLDWSSNNLGFLLTVKSTPVGFMVPLRIMSIQRISSFSAAGQMKISFPDSMWFILPAIASVY